MKTPIYKDGPHYDFTGVIMLTTVKSVFYDHPTYM